MVRRNQMQFLTQRTNSLTREKKIKEIVTQRTKTTTITAAMTESFIAPGLERTRNVASCAGPGKASLRKRRVR